MASLHVARHKHHAQEYGKIKVIHIFDIKTKDVLPRLPNPVMVIKVNGHGLLALRTDIYDCHQLTL